MVENRGSGDALPIEAVRSSDTR